MKFTQISFILFPLLTGVLTQEQITPVDDKVADIEQFYIPYIPGQTGVEGIGYGVDKVEQVDTTVEDFKQSQDVNGWQSDGGPMIKVISFNPQDIAPQQREIQSDPIPIYFTVTSNPTQDVSNHPEITITDFKQPQTITTHFPEVLDAPPETHEDTADTPYVLYYANHLYNKEDDHYKPTSHNQINQQQWKEVYHIPETKNKQADYWGQYNKKRWPDKYDEVYNQGKADSYRGWQDDNKKDHDVKGNYYPLNSHNKDHTDIDKDDTNKDYSSKNKDSYPNNNDSYQKNKNLRNQPSFPSEGTFTWTFTPAQTTAKFPSPSPPTEPLAKPVITVLKDNKNYQYNVNSGYGGKNNIYSFLGGQGFGGFGGRSGYGSLGSYGKLGH